MHLDGSDAGKGAHPILGIAHELGPQWASGRGQRDGDRDVAFEIGVDPMDHPEVDDVVAQFRIDHAAERVANRLFAGWGEGSGHRPTGFPLKSPRDRRYPWE